MGSTAEAGKLFCQWSKVLRGHWAMSGLVTPNLRADINAELTVLLMAVINQEGLDKTTCCNWGENLINLQSTSGRKKILWLQRLEGRPKTGKDDQWRSRRSEGKQRADPPIWSLRPFWGSQKLNDKILGLERTLVTIRWLGFPKQATNKN